MVRKKIYKMHDLTYEKNIIVQEKNVKNINNNLPCAHFIAIYNSS